MPLQTTTDRPQVADHGPAEPRLPYAFPELPSSAAVLAPAPLGLSRPQLERQAVSPAAPAPRLLSGNPRLIPAAPLQPQGRQTPVSQARLNSSAAPLTASPLQSLLQSNEHPLGGSYWQGSRLQRTRLSGQTPPQKRPVIFGRPDAGTPPPWLAQGAGARVTNRSRFGFNEPSAAAAPPTQLPTGLEAPQG